MLREFVSEYQDLYGAINMTLNVHLLLHIPEVVRKNGPLWAISNFCFESGNGRLRALVEGTRGVVSQITEKWASLFTLSEFLEEYPASDRVLKF